MKKTLSVAPDTKELLWGALYIIVQLFVLPFLLARANEALAMPLRAGKLNVIFFMINFGITGWIFRRFIRKTLLDALRHLPSVLISALWGFLLYWAGNLLVTLLILQLNPDFINVNDATIGTMVQEDFLPLAVCTVFFVPVTEELLFRGVLFAGFYNRSSVKAFLISVVVFSAIHVSGYILDYSWDTLLLCFLQYIPPSIALGWAYAKSGNILSPMLMHIVINTIGIFAMR